MNSTFALCCSPVRYPYELLKKNKTLWAKKKLIEHAFESKSTNYASCTLSISGLRQQQQSQGIKNSRSILTSAVDMLGFNLTRFNNEKALSLPLYNCTSALNTSESGKRFFLRVFRVRQKFVRMLRLLLLYSLTKHLVKTQQQNKQQSSQKNGLKNFMHLKL